MKFIASGTSFIAAALTDLALNRTGSHNLFIGPGILQILAVILVVFGIIDCFRKAETKTTPIDEGMNESSRQKEDALRREAST